MGKMKQLAIEAQQKRTPLPVHDGWHRTEITFGNNYLEENDFGDKYRLVHKETGLTSPEYVYPDIKEFELSPCIGCTKYPLGCKFCISL